MIKLTQKLSLLAFMSGIVSGCANTALQPSVYSPQAPTPEHFAPSMQRQLNASSHWSAIAMDLAKQLRKSLRKKDIVDHPIYLNLYSEDTEFTTAFNDFLSTHLVKMGMLVSKRREDAIIYNYKIQPVKYKSNRTTLQSDKFRWTLLTAGVVVARNIVQHVGSPDLIAAGVGADLFQSQNAPKLELIISSSILSNDIYLHKTTDIYYANAKDVHLYRQQQSNRSDVFDDPFYQ